jgi:hypothetical protein
MDRALVSAAQKSLRSLRLGGFAPFRYADDAAAL